MRKNFLQPLKIVLVDDDSDENYLFNEALEAAGLHQNLLLTLGGNQLMSMLKDGAKPNLIFLDLNMPYKDGLETLKEIKTNPDFADIKIVIYSTSKVKANVSACYDAGADLYVIKPDDFDRMVQAISSVCKIDWANYKRPAIDNGFLIIT